MYSNVGVSHAGVNTLQYSNGFVSFKADSDTVIPHTHNAAQCAQHCARDPNCVAWTRIAGEAFAPLEDKWSSAHHCIPCLAL